MRFHRTEQEELAPRSRRTSVQALYVLLVMIAAVAAGYSAFVVGIEREREQGRRRKPTYFLVQGSDATMRLTALDRALAKQMRRRTHGGGSRRRLN
jgi:hypothetical protein